MNKWQKLLKLIHSKKVGDVVRRQEILAELKEPYKRDVVTADVYRMLLYSVGVLKTIKPGVYEIKKHFKNKNISLNQVKELKKIRWKKWFMAPEIFDE